MNNHKFPKQPIFDDGFMDDFFLHKITPPNSFNHNQNNHKSHANMDIYALTHDPHNL